MTPSIESRLAGIRSCVTDLSANGIDVAAADDRSVRRVVREHLDYFQLMLGYEPAADDIVELINRVRREKGGGDGNGRDAH